MIFIVTTASGEPVKDSDKTLFQEEIAALQAKQIHEELTSSYMNEYYAIKRKYDQPVEFEFNNFDDLIAFSKEHGAIILRGNNITIYDDYVE